MSILAECLLCGIPHLVIGRIKDWLSGQFAGTTDDADKSKPVAKGKRMNLDPANMAASSLFSWDFDTEGWWW
jgi:hypothetical protein